MEEQRKTQRHRTLKTGTISFDRAAAIDCIIRNVSKAGACLEIASPVGIPDEFLLVMISDKVQRPCRVAWRSAHRIGVNFAPPTV
jgi:hypothetical protein